MVLTAIRWCLTKSECDITFNDIPVFWRSTSEFSSFNDPRATVADCSLIFFNCFIDELVSTELLICRDTQIMIRPKLYGFGF